ncbi:MAG: YwiC-like family protein [bacterium]|nr:YwiC-like family protein [bacterium]
MTQTPDAARPPGATEPVMRPAAGAAPGERELTSGAITAPATPTAVTGTETPSASEAAEVTTDSTFTIRETTPAAGEAAPGGEAASSNRRAPAPRKKRRKRLPQGWIPDQHGAWAMITIPALTGVVLAGFHWVHVPLLLFWWIGYFFFQAAMLWLKARRRPKYFPPVRAYGLTMIPFAAVLAVVRPYLAIWGFAFAPFIAIAVWCTVKRKERTYLNDSATVFAACLMMAVTFHANADHGDPGWVWLWLVLAVQFAYFWGTIPHIKALIRERERIEAARQSVLYHAVVAVVVTVLVVLGWFDRTLLGGWFLALLWWVLVARAYLLPLWQRKRGRIKPIVMGMAEVVFSLAMAAALLL